MKLMSWLFLTLLALALPACSSAEEDSGVGAETASGSPSIEDKLKKYVSFTLTTDLSRLSPREREMLPLLIEAAQAMDDAFWLQAYGDKNQFLDSLSDPGLRSYAEINYGPWDRLQENEPFVEGVGPKPVGAQFYPSDMTKDEFNRAAEDDSQLNSLYTMVSRDDSGGLQGIPYSRYFASHYRKAAEMLKAAAKLAEDPGLARYLELRSQALLSDDYQASDRAWMNMKDNTLDIVIGPVETYEDQLFGYKAANTAYVLVKDQEWSGRLSRYAALLPELQKELPVEEAYKRETPGVDSDLNAYDVIYYAGDCNAGSKTIAINLPNDEQVQLEKGTRRLQLKNAMRAKFDKILLPLSRQLIQEDQRGHIDFDAFFSNVMFHEVAHGLGIKNVIDGSGTVRKALAEQASALEEAKADILGLFMVDRLIAKGELEGETAHNLVTFLAGIFRSVRFGAASAHGRANLAEFNFLQEAGAFRYHPESETFSVDLSKMKQGVEKMASAILKLQGDGDYQGVKDFMQRYGQIDEHLRGALDRAAQAGIPVDVTFDQGLDVLKRP